MTQATQVSQPKRVFKLGTMRIDDPCPGKPLEEAVRLLSKNYVQFRSYRIWESDGVIEGDSILFEMRSPPAKANG